MKIVQIQNSFCLLEFKYIFFLASTSSTISIIAVKLLNAIMHTLHVTKKNENQVGIHNGACICDFFLIRVGFQQINYVRIELSIR